MMVLLITSITDNPEKLIYFEMHFVYLNNMPICLEFLLALSMKNSLHFPTSTLYIFVLYLHEHHCHYPTIQVTYLNVHSFLEDSGIVAGLPIHLELNLIVASLVDCL